MKPSKAIGFGTAIPFVALWALPLARAFSLFRQSQESSMTAKDMVYRELPNNTVTNMNRQRAFVESLAKQHKLGLSVTRTKADCDLLDLILKKKLIKKDQTWELQALGVVFGDALASEETKLRWMEVSDAWGTDPALLYADTTYQLNPVTIIQKRVEDGEEQPFVRSLAKTLLRLAREEAGKSAKR
jgi:hypothetical protein